MLILICRYGSIIIAMLLMVWMLFDFFSDLKQFELSSVIEYLLPAVIFTGVAYKLYPEQGKQIQNHS